jgi:hypothetical protein
MKKVYCIFLLMCFNVMIIYAQDCFMYVGGEKHYFVISLVRTITQVLPTKQFIHNIIN